MGSGPTVKFRYSERKIFNPPIFSNPNYQIPFEIHTDASDYGVGAISACKMRREGEVNLLCLDLALVTEKFKIYTYRISMTTTPFVD